MFMHVLNNTIKQINKITVILATLLTNSTVVYMCKWFDKTVIHWNYFLTYFHYVSEISPDVTDMCLQYG